MSKGTGITTNDVIEVEAWQPSRRIPPLPGPQGHGTMPIKGANLTVYLTGEEGKVYKPIMPNGITPMMISGCKYDLVGMASRA